MDRAPDLAQRVVALRRGMLGLAPRGEQVAPPMLRRAALVHAVCRTRQPAEQRELHRLGTCCQRAPSCARLLPRRRGGVIRTGHKSPIIQYCMQISLHAPPPLGSVCPRGRTCGAHCQPRLTRAWYVVGFGHVGIGEARAEVRYQVARLVVGLEASAALRAAFLANTALGGKPSRASKQRCEASVTSCVSLVCRHSARPRGRGTRGRM